MDNKIELQFEKRKPSFFEKVGKEVKSDLKEIKHETRLGAEAVREFFFGPRKIQYRKLSEPHKVHTMHS